MYLFRKIFYNLKEYYQGLIIIRNQQKLHQKPIPGHLFFGKLAVFLLFF